MTTKCWKIDNLCGFTLSQSVSFAGIVTLVISFVAMVCAFITVKDISLDNEYNNRPVHAINMIFSLYCFSISMYQIIISVMLLSKRSPFLCSVWFVSHLSILTLYCFMFTAKVIVSYHAKQYLIVTLTVLSAVIYEGVFIFFMFIVHSYVATMQ
ncbi:unnamed protein product [Arctia plantaginis]|uniref:Uncharacterized protein n=1 Tax=Arctia plantaginis TaxID=874455 RepID=A0A8S1AM93_ARCPL|nr:unnamed protein product [Arctia plantaginis]